MNLLFERMPRDLYREMAQTAIMRGMTAKEYVGAIASKAGLWHWIEKCDRSSSALTL